MAKNRNEEEVVPEPEPVVSTQKFNAAALADAKGWSRFEFDALVQLGAIRYEDEVTEKELEKLREKYYSTKNQPGGE
jgi:heterodisulfide reductase subunit A-like polyferredoxin